jgi:hypothetical protein
MKAQRRRPQREQQDGERAAPRRTAAGDRES